MGKWPFGVQLSAEQKLVNEALDCLDCPDSYLQCEEWEMDEIVAQEEADDDDDDVDLESERKVMKLKMMMTLIWQSQIQL